jgi:lipopolysaccharide transport system permease protein
MKQDDRITVISPPKSLVDINLTEIWKYRELLYIFAWRDIKVRYKQTALGIAWAVFQPLLTMIIFTVFFGNLAKIPSDGIPYPIFVYSGLLFWTYFSSSLTSASSCMIDNESIIKKIYFPRLLLSIGATITPVIDFCFAFIVYLGLMAVFRYVPNLWGMLVVPVLLFISLVTASGLGLFLASVNVKFRDVRYILPFFIQMLMFVTPVIYPVSIIPSAYKWVAYLNPMTGVISTARALILGSGLLDLIGLCISIVTAVILFICGIMYFRKTERYFADII